MDAFAFRSAALVRSSSAFPAGGTDVTAGLRDDSSSAGGTAGLRDGTSLFSDAASACLCGGRHRLPEAVLGESVSAWNLTTDLIGGRAPWGRSSAKATLGLSGIWHAHNLSAVAAFVRACRKYGLRAGVVGCSGDDPTAPLPPSAPVRGR